MHPHFRSVPCRCVERLLPRKESGLAVDPIAELCDRLSNLLVVFRQRPASTTRLARERAGRVDPVQRGHERREIDGRPLNIVDRAVGVLARQPLVHGPVERIALTRTPRCQRHRKSERQMRRELREPLRLRGRLPGRPADARQPGGQLLTEPIDVVIGPVRRDRLDPQIRPLRELLDEQTTYECDVGLDLVGMHSGRTHRRDPRRTGSTAATE